MKKQDKKKLLLFGGFAGLIGSLCCLGPLVIVALGLGSVSAALSLGKYSWLFTIIALLFYGSAVALYLKKDNCCNASGVRQNWRIILASFIGLALFLFLLKYKIAPVLAKFVYR